MSLRRLSLMAVCLLAAGLFGGPTVASSHAPALWIRLKAATFDPLHAEPDLPLDLRTDPGEEPAPYLVQMEGPILPAWPRRLEDAGATLLGYAPDYAYLAWMDATARERVAELPMVRWIGPYHPAYKLSADLEDYAGQVRVSLFPVEEEPTRALTQARDAGLEAREVTTTTLTLFVEAEQVTRIAAWPEVAWIQPQHLPRLHNNQAAHIIGAPLAWQQGYTGVGQQIAFADTGIDNGTSDPQLPDFQGRIVNVSSWPVIDLGDDSCRTLNVGADDGASDKVSGHGTHVMGTAAGSGASSGGRYRGMAPGAPIGVQAVEQFTTWTPEGCRPDGYYLTGVPADLTELFDQASAWDAHIHSNSWGYPGKGEYTAEAQDVDTFVWTHPHMTILFSAGNNGCDGTYDPAMTPSCFGEIDGYVDENSLDYPASAKNAIAVGASESRRPVPCPNESCGTWGELFPDYFPGAPTRDDLTADSHDHMAAMSSRGPAADGRIKPDLVAPGTWIASAWSTESEDPGYGQPISELYKYNLGTSMATAVVAGAVADLRQYYQEERLVTNPSAALLKATLLNTAVDMPGYGDPLEEAGQPAPNNHEGWGRLNLHAATSSRLIFLDGAPPLATGEAITRTYSVGTTHVPLRVTLAWSDFPGLLAAAQALVNDLDLEVIAPDGTHHRGNEGLYAEEPCLRDGKWDACNNVERVVIHQPAPGNYQVVVQAHNVPMGNAQPFAFVATGGFLPVWTETIYLPVLHMAPPEPPPCP